MICIFKHLALMIFVASSVEPFRAPENSTGLTTGLTSSLVMKPKANVVKTEAAETVDQLISTKFLNRKAPKRKWIDRSNIDNEYWYHPDIHSIGNVGFFGAIHAALAPISTKVIDMAAYNGEDVRSIVANLLSEKIINTKKIMGRRTKVLDMCCGVGISTRALQDVFPDSDLVVGVDTSPEMIKMARFLTSHVDFFKSVNSFFSFFFGKSSTLTSMKQRASDQRKTKCANKAKFTYGNAEKTGFPSESFELVTIMYAFHEVPLAGRKRILKEACRILQKGGTLAIVDISTEYQPSASMLMGEPYVLEYQKNIHRQLRTLKGFSNRRYETIIKNHVGMWTLRRNNV